ncbi:ABC transporter permease [Murimonas intestini]|uniref:ABC-type antimicrobial peptide transport system permease subunit n=1 Tax=Murimonas intestini TaxID=1337051 RepID=A0AB73TA99_9FIRM|nr:ABC transporter permease [Murimonas intestini]MCR1838930.1 ABC transporter permease [Murimonas intestini]MCR1864226.1 ABC transporter permease [Murimonas intestini]MCR1881836.1 ABC transporter permease [Murimonas intestini]
MNLWKRALLYTMRKKGKTVILFLVLFVMSTFVLTGLAIRSAADRSAGELRKSVGGSIKLIRDEEKTQNWTYEQGIGGTMVGYTGTPITDNEIEKIMQVKGIKSYNGIGYGSVYARDFSFISGIQFSAGSDYSSLPSVTHSEAFNYFRRKAFRLIKGRHITPEDDHVVLISTALADKNGLKLDDSITVRCANDAGEYPDVSLKIIGIYKSTIEEGKFNTTSTDKRNRLIIDHRAMKEIMQTDTIQYDNGIEFFVDDPKEIERITAEIQKLDLDWNCFKLTVDNSAYEAVASSLTAMQSMVTGLIIGIGVVSAGVLVLIVHMWIRQRVRETGILLSLGVGKFRIILQHIAETMFIALAAFGLSYFSSSLIAQGSSDLLFAQAAESQPDIEFEIPDDGREYMDLTGEFIPYDTSAMVSPDNIEVQVTRNHLLLVYMMGMCIVVFSVTLASRSVVKMKPGNILSQMS